MKIVRQQHLFILGPESLTQPTKLPKINIFSSFQNSISCFHFLPFVLHLCVVFDVSTALDEKWEKKRERDKNKKSRIGFLRVDEFFTYSDESKRKKKEKTKVQSSLHATPFLKRACSKLHSTRRLDALNFDTLSVVKKSSKISNSNTHTALKSSK